MITHYALYMEGYIEEDGKEVDSVQVATSKTKEGLIKFAQMKKLDFDRHYIDTVGYELMQGLRVPETFNDFPEYLNVLITKKQPNKN